MIKFTNSRLNCLAECPQKHHRAYVQGYRLIKEDSDALNFGSAFHWLQETKGLAMMKGDYTTVPDINSMESGQGSQLDPFEKARVHAKLMEVPHHERVIALVNSGVAGALLLVSTHHGADWADDGVATPELVAVGQKVSVAVDVEAGVR